jgi:hypothetical protein
MALTKGSLPVLTEVVAVQFTVGNSAAALSSTPVGASGLAYLQNDPTNTASSTIKIGDSNGQYWTLAVGEAFPFPIPVSNLNLFYCLGSTTGLKLNALILR